MSISSGVLWKGQAETQEGRTFEGAAFSKTLLKLADQRCRRTRRNPSSLERRRRQARRLVRFSFMAQGHTAEWLDVSSGRSPEGCAITRRRGVDGLGGRGWPREITWVCYNGAAEGFSSD